MKFIIALVVLLSVMLGIQSRTINRTGYGYGYNYGGNTIGTIQRYPSAAGRRIPAPRRNSLPATVNIVADLDYQLAAQSPAVFAIAPKAGVARKAAVSPQASNLVPTFATKPDDIKKVPVTTQAPKIAAPKQPTVVKNDSEAPQSAISGHGAIYIAKTLGSLHAAPLYGHTKSSINIA